LAAGKKHVQKNKKRKRRFSIPMAECT